MKRHRLFIIFILLLVATVALAASASARKPLLEQETAIWELSKTRVISPGTEVQLAEGTLISGYTLEAKAKTKSGELAEGTFELVMDAFQPAQDMEGQLAGWWYLRGNWTITRQGAEKAAKRVHSPDTMTGQMYAGLPSNPLAQPQNWSAGVEVPMTTVMGQWARGEGSLSLNAALEGDLYLQLTVWPEVN